MTVLTLKEKSSTVDIATNTVYSGVYHNIQTDNCLLSVNRNNKIYQIRQESTGCKYTL